MQFVRDVVADNSGPVRLYALPTGVSQVVTIRGSLRVRAGIKQPVQDLLASLLDKGTRKRDKFDVAELLENRGAVLGFSSNGESIGFSARCLQDDVRMVLDLIAEQLLDPRLDSIEVEKARTQLIGSVQRSIDHTGHRAACLLSAACYPPGHPNATPEPSDEQVTLQSVSESDLKTYHADHVGRGQPLMVVVGDIDPGRLRSEVSGAFKDWPGHEAAPVPYAEALSAQAGRADRHLADKQNIDVRIGHPIAVRRDDPDFVPLYVGNFILGGNFSARLMSAVRERMGLTYGIGSSLAGVSNDHQGQWRIHVTLSGTHLEQGVEATLAEARSLITDGVTADEVAEKTETVDGTFQVRMATTGGLAAMIHGAVAEGLGLEYLDTYGARLRSLRPDAVNEAVRAHLHPDRLFVAAAGSLPGKSTT